ncbi:MAG: hypothetical protein VB124_05940, partial [Burkholderia sp.]
HLLEAKNRELSQEPELLTGVLDWLLGINVNRSLARPIYATTLLEAGVNHSALPTAERDGGTGDPDTEGAIRAPASFRKPDPRPAGDR